MVEYCMRLNIGVELKDGMVVICADDPRSTGQLTISLDEAHALKEWLEDMFNKIKDENNG